MADVLPLQTPADRSNCKLTRRRLHSRLAVDAHGLAQLLSSGTRTVRAWDAAGKLPRPLKLGGRTLWYLPEIRAWLLAGAPARATWEALKAARRARGS